MKKITFFIACTLFINLSFSQISFIEDTSNSFVQLYNLRDHNVFFDYDLDGDEDLLLSGYDGTTRVTKLYSNSNGIFTEVTGLPFADIAMSPIKVIDYDNDEDLDLLISGITNTNTFFTKLYLNTNGVFTEDTTKSFESIRNGDMIVTDLDNDNLPDVILSGLAPGNIYKTIVYRNDGTIVTTALDNLELIAFNLEESDIDADGDTDFLISGYDIINSSLVSYLYKNDGSFNFTLQTTAIVPYQYGDAEFFDVDNDNDKDLIISGSTLSGAATKLYTNNGVGIFTEVAGTSFVNVRDSDIAYFDVENDGDYDLIIAGETSQDGVNDTSLYINDGNGNFTAATSQPFPDVRFPTISFSNVNGDNLTDVFITGGTTPTSNLFLNSTTLSIQDFSNSTIGIYPNPTKERFYIKSQQNIDTVSIYDVQGKRVKYFNNHVSQYYDIHDLMSGIYFVKLKSGNSLITKKLIKA